MTFFDTWLNAECTVSIGFYFNGHIVNKNIQLRFLAEILLLPNFYHESLGERLYDDIGVSLFKVTVTMHVYKLGLFWRMVLYMNRGNVNLKLCAVQ